MMHQFSGGCADCDPHRRPDAQLQQLEQLALSTILLKKLSISRRIEPNRQPVPLCVLQGIVVYLVKMLGRSNPELLILATVFMKKLSIYQENKDQMAASDAVPQLARLLATDNEVLLMAVLRLLHNLSFDAVLKDEMVKQGILPRVGKIAWHA